MRTYKNTQERDMQVLWFQSSAQTLPAIWKDMCSMWKNQPLHRSLHWWQKQKFHISDPQEQHHDEDNIDKVNINIININSINFNSKCSVITVNLNTSSKSGYIGSTI